MDEAKTNTPTNCGPSIGHEYCNLQFVVTEREGHKASPDAWRNSKKKTYLRKIAKQKKEKI